LSREFRALALIWCALCAIAPATASAGHPRDFVGIDSQDTFQAAFNNDMNAMTTNLSGQANIGVKIHRQPFNWDLLEPRKGRYDLSITDRYMTKMAAHGMRVLPVLFDAPPFHAKRKDRPGKGMYSRPKSGRALGKFGRALIKRYGPRGTFWKQRGMKRYRKRSAIRAWQIWNEPNLRQYWSGRPNAKQYVRMLLAARKQMRKAPYGKKAEIVTAGVPESKIRGAVPLRKYIPRMYKAGLRKIKHTFGFNAYANNTTDLNNKIRRVRKLMNKGRAKRKKIWITEIGWASAGKKHRLRKGRKGQAREITRAIRLIGKQRKKRRLRGFIYYNWRDALPYRKGIHAGTWGFHAGLIERDGDFKPAHRAFRRAVARLR
jgi:hypothetical protein